MINAQSLIFISKGNGGGGSPRWSPRYILNNAEAPRSDTQQPRTATKQTRRDTQ